MKATEYSPESEDAKLLDWQLRGVTDISLASFSEDRNMLFFIDRGTLAEVAQYHAMRAMAHEQTCRLPAFGKGSDSAVIGGLEFCIDENELLMHHDGGLSIHLHDDLFRADATKVVEYIRANRDFIDRIAPIRFEVGVFSPRRTTSLGVCDPNKGGITFYRDEHGGLLMCGIETIEKRKGTEFQLSVEQIILHEMAHSLERNTTVSETIASLTEDLSAFKDAGFPYASEFGKSLSAYAGSINGGYLPDRLLTWQETASTRPLATARMASEFWAELYSFALLGHDNVNVDPPIIAMENIRCLIQEVGATLHSGPLVFDPEIVRTQLPPEDSLHFEYAEDRIGMRHRSRV